MLSVGGFIVALYSGRWTLYLSFMALIAAIIAVWFILAAMVWVTGLIAIKVFRVMQRIRRDDD